MSSMQAWIDGRTKPKTKKELREAVAAGKDVTFEDTSFISNRGTLTADQLSSSDVIVGPDARTTRNWYASIRNGKVV